MYTDPKLKDAFTKAIKSYFDDNELTEYNKVAGSERKFNKKYFDGLETELTGGETEIEKKPKKKAKLTGNKSNSLRLK